VPTRPVSVPPPPPSSRARAREIEIEVEPEDFHPGWGRRAILIVGLLMLVVAAGVALLGSRGRGRLLVTLNAPASAKAEVLRVLVDGEPRCGQVPCQVSGLPSGAHFVKVELVGTMPAIEQTVTVHSGDESRLDLALPAAPAAGPQPSTQPEPSVGSSPSAQPDAGTTAASATGPSIPAQPAKVSRPPNEALPPPRKPLAETAAREQTGSGSDSDTAESKLDDGNPYRSPGEEKPADSTQARAMIRLDSTPPTQVSVDGKTLGTTPAYAEVAPGPRFVVFVHPVHGSKAITVHARPGQTTVAHVEFP